MVTITAPAGVTPSVALNGPAGYHLSLTASQTLSGLVPGTYTLTASSVVVANPIVATVYSATITGGTLTLAAGATAMASVSYAPQPGSGALWVVNPNRSTVVAYPAAQLVSNLPTPAVTLSATAGSLNVPFGLAFDVSGNLWIVNGDGPTVVEFAASQLGASGSPIPAVTLSASAGSLSGPLGLAFDASGNLWVANQNGSTVVEFTASQLRTSGSPTPAVKLTATAASLSFPQALAFDASGNLWVVNGSGSTVVEFTASQLGASGSPTPAVTLSVTTGSGLNGPFDLAFDGSGNLWVAKTDSTVVLFGAGQLRASGSPTPVITLRTAGSPQGLAFDANGDLWVSTGPLVVAYTAAQLLSSGTPKPAVTLSGTPFALPAKLAFNPPSASLPLR